MSTWSVRGYRQGDEDAIVRLHNRVFRTPTDVAAWHWKLRHYRETYSNVWVAEDAGEIIGQYAGVPTPFIRNGTPTMALLGADAMVAAAYRRQGVLRTLIEAAHAAWTQAGLEFIYGLPNEQWGRRVESFSPNILMHLNMRGRPLQPGTLLQERLGFSLPRFRVLETLWNRAWNVSRTDPSIVITELDSNESDVDRLWQSSQSSLKNSVIRDADRLRKRFLSHPHVDYRIFMARRAGNPAGYIVIRLAEVPAGLVGYLVEWFTHPDDGHAKTALIRFGIDLCLREGAVSVHAIAADTSPDDKLLLKAGFMIKQGKFALRISPLSAGFSPESPSAWAFQGGDFDVF